MLDDLTDFVVSAAVDVGINEAGKKSRTVRILQLVCGVLILAVFVLLIFITIKYS